MKMHWGNSIFLFLIVFVALCITFIIFAVTQNNDLVTPDYYEKAEHYSDQIEINNRSKAFSDSLSIRQNPEGVILIPAQTIVSNCDSITLQFYRSSNKKLDRYFKHKSDSLLALPASYFEPGFYRIKMGWKMNQVPFEIEHSFNRESYK